MLSLQGKVAIVTGSARGIGAEIALTLAQAGAKVVINYVENKVAADKVCAAIVNAGGECTVVQADVSDPIAVQKLFT
ncbi:MAG: SDR family NAD(P)-dependent oxidoreductase, partial [Methylococcales bacterium]|nr:SDR family NAD(P)-dependent oxidoreductase [Methylococcales bacterium]